MAGPTSEERQRAYARANQRARQRLVETHREEFQKLLDREKALEGIRKLQDRQVST